MRTQQLKSYTKAVLAGILIVGCTLSAQAQDDTAVAEGKKLFTENCVTCHKLGEDMIGPNLVGVLDRRKPEWVKSFIKNSSRMVEQGDADAKAVFEKYNKVAMTTFEGTIPDAGIDALVSYLKVAAPDTPPPAPVVVTTPAPTTPVAAGTKLSDNEKLTISFFAAFIVLIGAAVVALISQLISLQNALEPQPEGAPVAKRLPELGKGIISDIRGLFSGVTTNEVMADHSYDGIQELDNGMPPWLAYFFYVTIGFGIVYLLNYHVFRLNDLQEAEYQAEVAQAVLRYGDNKDKVKVQIVQISDKTLLENAKKVFDQNCVACHGKALEGGVGPNLTDNAYLHGGQLADVFNIIREGVPAKGMISWKGKLSDEEILQIASYIKTMEGTNPPNAKAPQGAEMK